MGNDAVPDKFHSPLAISSSNDESHMDRMP